MRESAAWRPRNWACLPRRIVSPRPRREFKEAVEGNRYALRGEADHELERTRTERGS